MTQDEIIEMARQARLMSEYDEASPWVEDHEITQYVEAFAKLVAAKEREACAKVCDDFPDVGYVDNKLTSDYHSYLIRKRGQA